jgi:hypothetical protein
MWPVCGEYGGGAGHGDPETGDVCYGRNGRCSIPVMLLVRRAATVQLLAG